LAVLGCANAADFAGCRGLPSIKAHNDLSADLFSGGRRWVAGSVPGTGSAACLGRPAGRALLRVFPCPKRYKRTLHSHLLYFGQNHWWNPHGPGNCRENETGQ